MKHESDCESWNENKCSCNSPASVTIICKAWPNGCTHPEICQNKCRDEDLAKRWNKHGYLSAPGKDY